MKLIFKYWLFFLNIRYCNVWREDISTPHSPYRSTATERNAVVFQTNTAIEITNVKIGV